MSWPERAALILRVFGGLSVIAAPVSAQRAGAAMAAQVHLMVTVPADPMIGAGLGVEVQVSSRVAVAGTATLGQQAGSTGVRWEGVVRYRLEPGRGSGVSWYSGGGVALQRFANVREYLLIVLGGEQTVAGSARWFGEIGLGGGVRGAVGVRLRPSRHP